MANGKLYPGGVDIATPFEMNDPQPIVSYMVVDTIANRDLLPNQFDGMNTFVVEAQVMYCKTNAGWVPIGVAKTFQELMQSNPNTTISPIIPAGTVSGAAVNKSQLDTKQDKSGNDGIRYVLFNGGLVQQIDTNTNVINTDLTQTSNRVHDLGNKILRFFNGIFQVPTLTFDETTADSLPNKDWTDGVKRYFTNNLGINKAFKFDEFTTQVIYTGGNYNNLVVTADLVIFMNINAQAIINGVSGKSDFLIWNYSSVYEVKINHNSVSVTGSGQVILLPTASGNMGVKGTARITKADGYGYLVTDAWNTKYRPEHKGLTNTEVMVVNSNAEGSTLPMVELYVYRDAQVTPMTKAQLNAAYPTALRPFIVVCNQINKRYEKVDNNSSDWIEVTQTLVV